VGRYQKGKTNLGFTEARDSEWQWHQLGHMQVCISLQTDNHASTSPLSFLQAGCPSCRPTNSVKALLSYLVNKLTLALSHCEPLWLNWTWCNNSTIKLIQANHNYCITNSITCRSLCVHSGVVWQRSQGTRHRRRRSVCVLQAIACHKPDVRTRRCFTRSAVVMMPADDRQCSVVTCSGLCNDSVDHWTTAAVLLPLHRSTCVSVSRHLQLRTGGFCWCKVVLPACPCWRQPALATLLVARGHTAAAPLWIWLRISPAGESGYAKYCRWKCTFHWRRS